MKPNDKVEEKEEEEEGPALAYGPLTYDEYIRSVRIRTEPRELCYGPLTQNESLEEDTISRLRSAFANQQEGFATLQAAAEHANQALLAGNLGQAHQALGAALVLSREQFHRRELAQEQANNNHGNNNNE